MSNTTSAPVSPTREVVEPSTPDLKVAEPDGSKKPLDSTYEDIDQAHAAETSHGSSKRIAGLTAIGAAAVLAAVVVVARRRSRKPAHGFTAKKAAAVAVSVKAGQEILKKAKRLRG